MYNSGSLSEATIEQVIVNELGQVLIDVIDDKGEFYEGVKVCGVGGNTLCWSNYPLRASQRVKLLKTSLYEQPVCIGSTEKFFNKEDYEDLKPVIVSVQANNDEDVTSNAVTDWSIINYQTGVKVTEKNGLVINSDQMMRFQLGADALFRISKNGATVDEPLNGQQFIDTLFAYLDVLEQRVLLNSQFTAALARYNVGPAEESAAEYTASAATKTQAGDLVGAAQDTQEAAKDTANVTLFEGADASVGAPLTTSSATTKTSAEDNINRHVKLP